ncbi:hypothetical protein KKG22_03540 [Patescibacteria group bacterium]|nr:hypothetical protein [Patescibacteria group bacterium]MBU1721223.1 hypothetical protein [Patescibacteria group bacterium]MBU1901069.1 hypothetical protein [Patescibacteria group bacterium]
MSHLFDRYPISLAPQETLTEKLHPEDRRFLISQLPAMIEKGRVQLNETQQHVWDDIEAQKNAYKIEENEDKKLELKKAILLAMKAFINSLDESVVLPIIKSREVTDSQTEMPAVTAPSSTKNPSTGPLPSDSRGSSLHFSTHGHGIDTPTPTGEPDPNDTIEDPPRQPEHVVVEPIPEEIQQQIEELRQAINKRKEEGYRPTTRQKELIQQMKALRSLLLNKNNPLVDTKENLSRTQTIDQLKSVINTLLYELYLPNDNRDSQTTQTGDTSPGMPIPPQVNMPNESLLRPEETPPIRFPTTAEIDAEAIQEEMERRGVEYKEYSVIQPSSAPAPRENVSTPEVDNTLPETTKKIKEYLQELAMRYPLFGDINALPFIQQEIDLAHTKTPGFFARLRGHDATSYRLLVLEKSLEKKMKDTMNMVGRIQKLGVSSFIAGRVTLALLQTENPSAEKEFFTYVKKGKKELAQFPIEHIIQRAIKKTTGQEINFEIPQPQPVISAIQNPPREQLQQANPENKNLFKDGDIVKYTTKQNKTGEYIFVGIEPSTGKAILQHKERGLQFTVPKDRLDQIKPVATA